MSIINYHAETTFKCDQCGKEAVSGDTPPELWYTLTGSQIDQRDTELESGVRVILSDKGGHFCCKKCLRRYLVNNVRKIGGNRSVG